MSGSYMFCMDRLEADLLEAQARAKVPLILQELGRFVNSSGRIGINVRRVLYPFTGYAIEADLTYDGEVARSYEGFDLLELELDMWELKIMAEQRRALDEAGKCQR